MAAIASLARETKSKRLGDGASRVRFLDGKDGIEDYPTSVAVARTCDRIDFDPSDTFAMIQEYASRNQTVHENLDTMTKKGIS